MARAYEKESSRAPEELAVVEKSPNCVSVIYTPSIQKLNGLDLAEEVKQRATEAKKELLLINGQDNFNRIYPINTRTTHIYFLKNKYEKIESITLDGFSYETPSTVDGVLVLLEELPSGFVKDYEYGLGLLYEYRFIINAIENIPDVMHLVISKKTKTSVDGAFYTLNYREFEQIRKKINTITNAYQVEAREEKIVYSYNSLLHNLNPLKYREKKKQYKNGSIKKVLSGFSSTDTSISATDIDSVVNFAVSKQKQLHKVDKKKVIKLQEDLELLKLEWLIEESERLLSSGALEPKWQDLLNNNPFLISLVFGYPVVKIHGQASVGGRKLTGSGDKITDFLIKNKLTNNVALVEIKKPKTELLNSRAYRYGVYAPSSELSGSISQLLDQKYNFQKEIAVIKDNSGVYDIESFSIDCVLIIGLMPTEKERIKSFEFFRHNSRDIRIYTFDELVKKLKNVYAVIKN